MFLTPKSCYVSRLYLMLYLLFVEDKGTLKAYFSSLMASSIVYITRKKSLS